MSGATPWKSRRTFLGNVTGAAAAAMTIGGVGLEPVLGGRASIAEGRESRDGGDSSGRARSEESERIRIRAAEAESRIPVLTHPTNGDEGRYGDKSGTYTKGLPHDSVGRVDLSAFESLTTALKSGRPEDFENIMLGGGRLQTNPQAGLAFDLEGTDSFKFGVPPAPAVATAEYAAEMVELYWGSLLRDVPFGQYDSDPLVAQAAQELTSLAAYAGPRDPAGMVTPHLLFRGGFPGEAVGPYVSQFFVQPTFLGAQPLSQRQVTYMPGIDSDYMTDFGHWLTVQNGGATGLTNQPDARMRFVRSGRDLAAWTHVDVLYQAYFVAYCVLAGLGVPANPGLPYLSSRTQVGFGTFGGQHAAGMIGEVAYRALERSWYQKWFVHRRLRPEAGGGLVDLIKTGQGNNTDATLSDDLLKSQAVQSSFNKYGSYLLSQAFPEGSPTHPSYPTGHGVVAGACLTILKFFFDGSYVFQNPVMPAEDGLSLIGFEGPALSVNGELAKLGHNVSFGHGIHAGIHYRSDTDASLFLGEATALSILQDQADTFNEKFSVCLTKFDGTTATISNE